MKKGRKQRHPGIFEKPAIIPNVHFTTWGDYAILSMVENELGISILPELILKRAPNKILKKELEIPAYRKIGFVMKDSKTTPLPSNAL